MPRQKQVTEFEQIDSDPAHPEQGPPGRRRRVDPLGQRGELDAQGVELVAQGRHVGERPGQPYHALRRKGRGWTFGAPLQPLIPSARVVRAPGSRGAAPTCAESLEVDHFGAARDSGAGGSDSAVHTKSHAHVSS